MGHAPSLQCPSSGATAERPGRGSWRTEHVFTSVAAMFPWWTPPRARDRRSADPASIAAILNLPYVITDFLCGDDQLLTSVFSLLKCRSNSLRLAANQKPHKQVSLKRCSARDLRKDGGGTRGGGCRAPWFLTRWLSALVLGVAGDSCYWPLL